MLAVRARVAADRLDARLFSTQPFEAVEAIVTVQRYSSEFEEEVLSILDECEDDRRSRRRSIECFGVQMCQSPSIDGVSQTCGGIVPFLQRATLWRSRRTVC